SGLSLRSAAITAEDSAGDTDGCRMGAWAGSGVTRGTSATGSGATAGLGAGRAGSGRHEGAGAARRVVPASSPTSIQNSWLTAVKVRYWEVVSSTTMLTTPPRQTAPRTSRLGSLLLLDAQATAATEASMITSTARPGSPAP